MMEAKEACGVFGVYAPGRSVAHLTFDGLYALQHRGQESAGMAVSDGDLITVMKDMGLVTTVFDERKLSGLRGHLAIGHTRYSTAGSSDWINAQPVFRGVGRAGFGLAHNGNLTNTDALAEQASMLPGMVSSDSDLVAELLAQAFPPDRHRAVPGRARRRPRARADGGAAQGRGRLLLRADGRRPDHRGARPQRLPPAVPRPARRHRRLRAGLGPGLGVARPSTSSAPRSSASSSPARWSSSTARRSAPSAPSPSERLDPRLCIFEFVYFARPDTTLYGNEVHGARRRMGQLLATQRPVQADLVMGVPDSGVPAAEGYAFGSGIPYGQGLVKNRYIGRTFIAPTQAERANGVRRKLNPLRENIAGKRVVVVDDSIVRGTTTRAMVKMLREAGAVEVHLRISSPPFKWPCFYGIDTPDRTELLAAVKTPEEITEFLDVDSLEYLSLEHLVEAIDAPGAGFCDACLTGTYPVPVGVKVEIAERPAVTAAAGSPTA